ncbi:ORF6N domain-containing protein [Xenorhabdus bovienii]|uniref:ORF6N domain-containing protein n=1 Tax=Xenorhabdus bovienii TaxID=40576 RepID=UPI0023B259A8|nr:ORF6N domain-containing protein [Xenorhabdus bovienii]MDE9552770.1 ORF6N domain-containing protein [Xenorhabdus bovienii]
MLSIQLNEVCKSSNSVQSMTAIMHNSIPVITTELLANVYETDEVNIKMNFSRNAERFTHGKHYFKLEGADLKQFKNRVTESYSVEDSVKVVGKRARSLILWTERGAARHAKMLDTDKAWNVFEKLEDFYFNQKEAEPVAAKTTTQSRTPLRGLVNTIMGKYGLNSKKLFQMVHHEFGVNHIDELTHDQLPSAIEYLATKVIEGEYLGREELPKPNIDLSSELRNANALHKNLMHLKDVWDRLNPHLFVLAPDIAHAFNGAFSNVSGPVLSLRNGIERKACLLN